ncbi:hypothetical protein CDL15_Pgr006521 [Punica granatum]|uniref:Uncharacterized protein n=1 Tax=Punica granatum TaxID=22663 RepID=A0A218XZG3_PUNGR|nr:hypothetical protein CDL15_Pgr006521 [Punica granatum]
MGTREGNSIQQQLEKRLNSNEKHAQGAREARTTTKRFSKLKDELNSCEVTSTTVLEAQERMAGKEGKVVKEEEEEEEV